MKLLIGFAIGGAVPCLLAWLAGFEFHRGPDLFGLALLSIVTGCFVMSATSL